LESRPSISESGSLGIRRTSSLHRNRSLGKKTPKKLRELEAAEQAKYLNQEYNVEIEKTGEEKKEVIVEDKTVEGIRKALELKKKMKQLKIEEELGEQKKLKDLQDKIKAFEKQKKTNGFTFDYSGNVILMKRPFLTQVKSPVNYDLNKPIQIAPKSDVR